MPRKAERAKRDLDRCGPCSLCPDHRRLRAGPVSTIAPVSLCMRRYDARTIAEGALKAAQLNIEFMAN